MAPGESYAFDPNEVVGPGWQGSVWLRSSQPMGVVVDPLGANHFGAYHGVPADVFIDGGSGDFSLGTQVNYAPLIYREHQGWESTIQVQNLGWGIVRPGFMGSLVISATYTDQPGGAALGAVAVERVGRVGSDPDIPGDESKAFEAFPLFNRFTPEEGTPVTCPGQP